MIMNVVADYISCSQKNTAGLPQHGFFLESYLYSQNVDFNFLSLTTNWAQDSFLINAMKYKVYKWWCCVALKTKSKRWCDFQLTWMLTLAIPACTMLWGSLSSPQGESQGHPCEEKLSTSSANSQQQLPIMTDGLQTSLQNDSAPIFEF